MIDNAYSAAPVCIRPMGDQGILVEFGDRINTAIHERVLSFDAQLRASPFRGFTESVPAYASVYVGYDCLVTDLNTVVAEAEKILDTVSSVPVSERRIAVQVCYDDPFAPDLPTVANRLGLSTEEVVRAHLGGDYRVFMYGFAPGYAYLGGVPSSLNLPRKSSPVRNVPAGSVLIAGRAMSRFHHSHADGMVDYRPVTDSNPFAPIGQPVSFRYRRSCPLRTH